MGRGVGVPVGRGVARAVVVVVLVGLVAGCASGEGGPADGDATETGSSTSADAAASDVPAALGIIEPGVDVADEPPAADGADFRAGEDGEGLVAGDLVRTDADGFAEVRWTQGALARIDVDTLFEVTVLDLTTGRPVVSTHLDVGRVWNRLDTGAAEYEVATDVATAAVRGTAFVVACEAACTFTVLEGVLVVTTILGIELEVRAGEQVVVAADGVPGTVEEAPDPRDDPWLATNLDRDEDGGFAPVTPPPDQDDDGRTALARGRLEGSYDFTFTMQESTDPATIGAEYPRTWSFSLDCDQGACGGTMDRGDGPALMAWTGSGYVVSWVDRPSATCPDGTTLWLEDIVLRFTPSELDAEGVATVVDGSWVSTLTPTDEAVASGCVEAGAIDQVLTGTGVPS